MRTKRLTAAVLAVFMLFPFSSCSVLLPSYAAKQDGEKYFKYLKNKDIDKLIELFSDDVNDTHDLYKEWEEFYGSLDGNIVSYGKISTGGEGEHIDNGKTTYYIVTINYENVETDTGKIYESISYTQVRENKKHPENKGISLFVVRLPSDNEKGFEEKIVGGFVDYTD